MVERWNDCCANAQAITVDASGVADKAVYSFKATVAGKVVGRSVGDHH